MYILNQLMFFIPKGGIMTQPLEYCVDDSLPRGLCQPIFDESGNIISWQISTATMDKFAGMKKPYFDENLGTINFADIPAVQAED